LAFIAGVAPSKTGIEEERGNEERQERSYWFSRLQGGIAELCRLGKELWRVATLSPAIDLAESTGVYGDPLNIALLPAPAPMLTIRKLSVLSNKAQGRS
jgi:hypothetical protein